VYTDVGSRYENRQYSGITRFMEQMAFMSSENRSAFRLVREMSKFAINLSASSGREHIVHSGDALRDFVPYILGTIQDVTLHPDFDLEEVNSTRFMNQHEFHERASDAEGVILESIHEAAYVNKTLGQTVYPRETNLERFNTDSLKAWARAAYTPSRMVISGVGVHHASFVAQVKEMFDFPATKNAGIPKTQAKYVGGDLRMHRAAPGDEDEQKLYFALAFEGESWQSKDVSAMCVLQTIMGGGKGFSSGDYGKGNFSRLYTNVVSKLPQISSVNAFTSIYTDSSLFGFYGSTDPEYGADLTSAFTNAANDMASGNFTADEINAAKAQLKASVLGQLESPSHQSEDIARQLATTGKVLSPLEYAAQIDAVTANDVARVAKRIVSSQPSMAAYGDLTALPRYDEIARALRS
jgi:processing peptidase subunit alpha